MNIILRNFFRLVRAGVFATDETIEPMSDWKWDRLYQTALQHGVVPLVYDGITRCRQQFFLNLPDALDQHWQLAVTETEEQSQKALSTLEQLLDVYTAQQWRPIVLQGQSLAALYPTPLHRPTPGVDIFLPYETQGRKADQWAATNGTPADGNTHGRYAFTWHDVSVTHHHHAAYLTNALLSRTLQAICEKEIRESTPTRISLGGRQAETLSPTLAVLLLIVTMAHSLLNSGLLVCQLTDLGIMLREAGHKTDFVKLQEWTDRLHLGRMSQLCGELLVGLMHFTPDEIPFMRDVDDKRLDSAVQHMGQQQSGPDDWYFQQAGDIFVHTANSSAMIRQVRQSVRYLSYYPSESITNFFTSFAHSLSHIEE